MQPAPRDLCARRRRPLTPPDLRDDDLRLRQRRRRCAEYNEGQGRRSISTRATRTRRSSAVEQKLAALDGAEAALLLSSGQAATTTALMALLTAGDEVVCSAAIYGGTLHLLTESARAVRRRAALRVARGARPTRQLLIGDRDARGLVRVADQPDAALRRRRGGRRRVPRARRALGHRQHLRQPDQPAAARARRRPVDAERDEVSERPQRRHRRRAHRAGAR